MSCSTIRTERKEEEDKKKVERKEQRKGDDEKEQERVARVNTGCYFLNCWGEEDEDDGQQVRPAAPHGPPFDIRLFGPNNPRRKVILLLAADATKELSVNDDILSWTSCRIDASGHKSSKKKRRRRMMMRRSIEKRKKRRRRRVPNACWRWSASSSSSYSTGIWSSDPQDDQEDSSRPGKQGSHHLPIIRRSREWRQFKTSGSFFQRPSCITG